jgi:hydroxyacylglutathione hydrolase
MYIEQIYTSCLAQASYYIESNGEAVIIDPIRDSEPYLRLLKNRNANLKYILETHFHADFVSGHIELANLTNAEIVFGPNATTSYKCIIADDKEEFRIGELVFRVLHTPGHTMESTCYLLLSTQNVEQAVFTGDTLFVGEVGRPDLAVNPNLTSKDLAKKLYQSIHNVLMKLPDDVVVYPGHGAGSACGKNISAERESTIGTQKKCNYALQPMSEEKFVEIVLDGIAPAPIYFAHDVNLNKNGYQSVSHTLSKSLNQLSPKQISSEIETGAIVLDVRLPNAFEKGFIPGSINIGKTGMFAPWVGTIISPQKKLIIFCNNGEEEEVVSRLARIGYENIIGYINSLDEWRMHNQEIDIIQSIDPSGIVSLINDKSIVLDVRKRSELEIGFVKNSIHIPLDKLQNNLNQIKKTDNFLIYCAGGYRSMIAASILKSKGYQNITNIYGGFSAISKTIDSCVI